ncbi:MAG: hypothetical protein EOQ55_12565 [Mesorhizobium sp.]|uniref:hypothetical protein n=1 Tax=Mesorhizobium sp. TaxID=1871066 RepID=UPI000FE95E59|nr:hypothetical protein [Mesorhizobium sp.]RWG20123.1 MAG: hypothetical protein EOQ55_12565 [Mesorhizobium sp.]RWI96180.1 MAG: hypothetical protein EOR21_09175 [Mesorhizobium sp.]
MTKRGRKSTAELSTVATLTQAPVAPDAPYDLGDEAASVWRGIVDALPSDFFPPESFDTLSSYCRHVVSARFLARELDRFSAEWLGVDGGIERLNKLLMMRERETRALIAAARALRLTNQSRWRPDQAGKVAGGYKGPKPWE